VCIITICFAGVGPITKAITDDVVDLREFWGAIDDLRAHGGGDCAEYALDAILQTLDAHDDILGPLMTPGSQIIVLTDAPSKNTAIQGNVTRLARDLGVCIHFFLALETVNCFSDVPGSVERYRRIAQETRGSVVENGWQFSNFVASYKDSSCTDSPDMRKRSAIMDFHCRSFQVSRFTTLLNLSVRPSETGLSTVTVRKPGGDMATPPVIDSNTNNRFAVFTELHPESGVWSVCVENGTVEVYTSLKTTLDVVVLYPKNETRLSGAVPTTSNTPPACKILKNAFSRESDSFSFCPLCRY